MITLKTLAQATPQDVFNQAYLHLLTQNAKSINEDETMCQYRGPNSLKCAVGCFIADDEYDPNMECKGWYALTHNYDDLLVKPEYNLREAHYDLLKRLQTIHDGDNPEHWKILLERLAQEKDLTCPDLPL
jgi:hypothetical protein